MDFVNMKLVNIGRILRKSIVCCVILAISFVNISCGVQANTQWSGTSSGGEALSEAQQPESDQKERYGSVLASHGVVLPVSRPSIYVNMTGYMSDREKLVIFAGDKHGQTFDVVRSQDGEVVYTGNIPRGKEDLLSGQVLRVGNFTDVKEPGTYYIHTDIVGQSYSFEIAEDTYEELFLRMLKNVFNTNLQESPEGVCDVSFGMHVVMCALQCNGSLFEAAYKYLDKEEQDKQLVTQLLYMGKWLISRQQSDGSLCDNYEATAAFCGIMAMSRDMFGRYEERVDKEYQQAAAAAWNWLEKQSYRTESEERAHFYAAAQLFKSEGGEEYKSIVEAFLREHGEDYLSEHFVFYGVLAYISAESGTDRELCTYIMKDVVNHVDAICAKIRKDDILGVGTRTVEENISNMLYLSFVNYLTPSKEYTIMIENTIQYMGGLNEEGICYTSADGTQMQRLEWRGIMLMSVSDLLSNISEIEKE